MAKKKVLFFYPRFVEEYKALLEKNVPEAEFMICKTREDMERYAPEAEIALVGMTFPQEFFQKMPKLEWIQAMAAGVEGYMANAALFKNIPVCRHRGFRKVYRGICLGLHPLFLPEYPTRSESPERKKMGPLPTWSSFTRRRSA